MDDSPWNSLEVVKIVLAFLTPLLLLGLGFVINRVGRRVEDSQWANRKLIEQRLEVYDRLAPGLNDLYCFVRVRGDFRAVTPPKAVELKRGLDKEFHINKFLFSERFSSSYHEFIGLMFDEGGKVATDARIRVDPERQRMEMGDEVWDTAWEERFSPPEKQNERKAIGDAYTAFMQRFAEELGVMPGEEGKAA